MEGTEEKVFATAVEISEINASKMTDLDCSTVNKIIDTEEAVPNDGTSSRSESFFQHCYRSEEQEMSKNTNWIEESQAKENDDTSVASGSDLYCGRFKSVPSLPPSLKDYFDMAKEEYCKKLKTKKKSKSGNLSGKPNSSSLKGDVFFNEPTKRIVAPKNKYFETMNPSEETQHKNKGNERSGKEKTNSNEAKLADNSNKAALRLCLNTSNAKFDQVIDLNKFEGDFESTESENAKQAVSVLVSYFENLRRFNSKQEQKKIPEGRGEKKVLESAKSEESPHIRNESIHFPQSTVTKKKHKNKMIEVSSSENAVASSSSEVSNTRVNDLSRCWINKKNSYPMFVFNDCITRGSSIHRNISKNRTKRSKCTMINLKSPSSPIQTLGKKANRKLQRSKSKKQKETKCKRGNNAKTSTKNFNKQPRMLSQNNNKIGKKKNYSTKTFQAVATVFVGMIAFVLAAAVMRSANE